MDAHRSPTCATASPPRAGPGSGAPEALPSGAAETDVYAAPLVPGRGAPAPMLTRRPAGDPTRCSPSAARGVRGTATPDAAGALSAAHLMPWARLEARIRPVYPTGRTRAARSDRAFDIRGEFHCVHSLCERRRQAWGHRPAMVGELAEITRGAAARARSWTSRPGVGITEGQPVGMKAHIARPRGWCTAWRRRRPTWRISRKCRGSSTAPRRTCGAMRGTRVSTGRWRGPGIGARQGGAAHDPGDGASVLVREAAFGYVPKNRTRLCLLLGFANCCA